VPGEDARRGLGTAARLAKDGEERAREEWISPRLCRRGVDPPELRQSALPNITRTLYIPHSTHAGKNNGVPSLRPLPAILPPGPELGGSRCAASEEGGPPGEEVGKCRGEEDGMPMIDQQLFIARIAYSPRCLAPFLIAEARGVPATDEVGKCKGEEERGGALSLAAWPLPVGVDIFGRLCLCVTRARPWYLTGRKRSGRLLRRQTRVDRDCLRAECNVVEKVKEMARK
jgi:hypothetical protein